MSIKELSKDIRDKVVERHRSGDGYKNISKALNIPWTTVKTIIKKWKAYGTPKTMSRSCHPSKLDNQARKRPTGEVTKPQFQLGLQSQSPTGNPPLCKVLLGPPELLTTYKAFVRSLMEYCSPLWAGAPASHLSRLHAVETEAFWIIGISCDEAESLGLSLSHRRQIGGLSVFHCLLSSLAPSAVSVICPHHISAGRSRSANNPLLVKLPKSRITAHLHSFIPLFPPPLE